MIKDNQAKQGLPLQVLSGVVLPTARTLYLLVALGSLLAVLGGIVYIVFLQASAAGQPTTRPLPPPHGGSPPSVNLSEIRPDSALLSERLHPPSDVRFHATSNVLVAPPPVGEVLGRFTASTPNGLAAHPDGISILGGPDAQLFERVPTTNGAVGLAPREALVQQIAQMLAGLDKEVSRAYTLSVIARDRFGILSAPTTVTFSLRFAPKPTQPEPEPAAEQALTPLQSLARDIARTIEPEVNPDHFSAYRTAQETPATCGAAPDDREFLDIYGNAFSEHRDRLTAANIKAFYSGLCALWADLGQRRYQAQQDADAIYQAAWQTAEQARERVRSLNDRAIAEHAARRSNAMTQTLMTLSVVGGAFGLFLSVSLVLAFLAIENHSRAMRSAIEAMVGTVAATRAPGTDNT
jgi:hypothetical protein